MLHDFPFQDEVAEGHPLRFSGSCFEIAGGERTGKEEVDAVSSLWFVGGEIEMDGPIARESSGSFL